MAFKNLAANIDKAVAEGADQTVAQQGGAGAEPPAAGPCNLRLVGYIETGKHAKSFNGAAPKDKEQVTLLFEVSGKNHPPIETEDGPRPHIITINETLSLNEKARYFKLFQLLNYKGVAKHAAALAAECAAYRGRILHREYTDTRGQKRISAELYDKAAGMWTITPPRVEVVDEDGQPTGEYREVKVNPSLSPQRVFMWNYADQEQWDSLFIDGEYPERKNDKGEVTAPAKSRNQFQLKIAAAKNYKGSPIQVLLAEGGKELAAMAEDMVDDVPGDEDEAPAQKPTTKPAAAAQVKRASKGDPLAGVA
jgi:hypothetical protein